MKALDSRRKHVLNAVRQFNLRLPDNDKSHKYSKMSESAFIFFRGTSHLFWSDMSHDWKISLFGGQASSQIWLQGDAHIHNFGALHDHYDHIYFGMDDFDDAIIGDFQYDLWRLATSMVLDLKEKHYYSDNLADKAVKALGKSYLAAAACATEDNPALNIEQSPLPIQAFLNKVHKKNTRQKMLKKWTDSSLNKFDMTLPKLVELNIDNRKKIYAALNSYFLKLSPKANFSILDVAKRTQAGTGSLGNQRFYALIAGATPQDNVILDIKQQRQPAAVSLMPQAEQNWYTKNFSHEGKRHYQAYQAIAEHPDRWLGWTKLDNIDFSIRERSPFKKDFPTENLSEQQYLEMAEIWGQVLGKEHARGSLTLQNEQSNFIKHIQDNVIPKRKAFLRILRSIALSYARCVHQDWDAFCKNHQK